jgi:two-component system chemotaxis response regulator CheB
MATVNATDVIVIGGSAGALEVLGLILSALPKDFLPTVVIVLHLPAAKPSILPKVLAARSALPVREPDDKEALAPNTVYVAPPGYHLLIEKTRSFALSIDDLVQFSRPSIDVLFDSAADALGATLTGVLLTGANEDGARGLRRIKAAGGRSIVQTPSSAAVAMMPEAGVRLAEPDAVLAPHEIGPFLAQLGAPTPRRESTR